MEITQNTQQVLGLVKRSSVKTNRFGGAGALSKLPPGKGFITTLGMNPGEALAGGALARRSPGMPQAIVGKSGSSSRGSALLPGGAEEGKSPIILISIIKLFLFLKRNKSSQHLFLPALKWGQRERAFSHCLPKASF